MGLRLPRQRWSTCFVFRVIVVPAVCATGATSWTDIISPPHTQQGYKVIKEAGYNPMISPPGVTVYLAMKLTKLHSVDAGAGIFKATAWVRRYWLDPRLSLMNATDGVIGVVDAATIWTPDISMREQVDNFQESCSTPQAAVFNHKTSNSMSYNVFYSQACIFTVKCTISMRDFPFDSTKCHLTWVPWADRSYRLEAAPYMSDHTLTSQIYNVSIKNVAWKPIPRDVLPGMKESSYPDGVLYEMRLGRFSRYYIINYILPLLLCVILSWFTFFIPMGASDRISYAVTLLLTAMAILFITSDERPPEKQDGWIDVFQITVLSVVTFPILQTICLHRIIDRQEHHSKGNKKNGHKQARLLDRLTRVGWPMVLLTTFGYQFLPFQPMWAPGRPAWSGITVVVFCLLWTVICLTVCICAVWNFRNHGPHSPTQVVRILQKGFVDEKQGLSDSEHSEPAETETYTTVSNESGGPI